MFPMLLRGHPYAPSALQFGSSVSRPDISPEFVCEFGRSSCVNGVAVDLTRYPCHENSPKDLKHQPLAPMQGEHRPAVAYPIFLRGPSLAQMSCEATWKQSISSSCGHALPCYGDTPGSSCGLRSPSSDDEILRVEDAAMLPPGYVPQQFPCHAETCERACHVLAGNCQSNVPSPCREPKPMQTCLALMSVPMETVAPIPLGKFAFGSLSLAFGASDIQSLFCGTSIGLSGRFALRLSSQGAQMVPSAALRHSMQSLHPFGAFLRTAPLRLREMEGRC